MALCECGCGTDTGVWEKNHPAQGYVKGESKRYILGHAGRKWFDNFQEDDQTGCWVWTGARKASGYGKLTDGRDRLAHQWMYEYFVGPTPEGLELDHLCRNRACVNPGHLEPVTRLENVRRGVGPKLSVEKVREIQDRFQGSLLGARQFGRLVADEFGVSPNTVRDVVGRRSSWHDVPHDSLSERRVCSGCGQSFHRQGYPNHLRSCQKEVA